MTRLAMTEMAPSGHGSTESVPLGGVAPRSVLAASPAAAPSFEAVYREHFAFVWRNLRRLGVAEAGLRDAAQEVFLVVHRRLPEFEPRSPLRAWLYSILRRVASDARRSERRHAASGPGDADALASPAAGPEQGAVHGQKLRLLISLLTELDDDKREAWILSELEGMTAPEIAATLGCNMNTVYSRVRVARERLRASLEQRTKTTELP